MLRRLAIELASLPIKPRSIPGPGGQEAATRRLPDLDRHYVPVREELRCVTLGTMPPKPTGATMVRKAPQPRAARNLTYSKRFEMYLGPSDLTALVALAREAGTRITVILRAILAEVLGSPEARGRVIDAARTSAQGDRRAARHW